MYACTVAGQNAGRNTAARGKQEMTEVQASVLGFCWPRGVNHHNRKGKSGRLYRDCNGKNGYCTMEHEGLEDLTKDQVCARQEGMDRLIAHNHDGGAKKGKDQTPKDSCPDDHDPNINSKDSNTNIKDRGKNKTIPKCPRCGIDGHNIFDCRDNPESDEYCYRCEGYSHKTITCPRFTDADWEILYTGPLITCQKGKTQLKCAHGLPVTGQHSWKDHDCWREPMADGKPGKKVPFTADEKETRARNKEVELKKRAPMEDAIVAKLSAGGG